MWGQRGVGVDKGALQNSRPCNTKQSLVFRRFRWERPISQALLGIALVWGQRGVSVDKG